jgi:hypothetical protein
MARSSDQLRADLPVQAVPGPQRPVELDWRWRWDEIRRDALEQRALPVQQPWRRERSAPGESVRLFGRAKQVGAGTSGDLERRPVVVGVRVGQDQLAERDGVFGDIKPPSQRSDDRLALAGDVRIDQDNPITIADGVTSDNRGA